MEQFLLQQAEAEYCEDMTNNPLQQCTSRDKSSSNGKTNGLPDLVTVAMQPTSSPRHHTRLVAWQPVNVNDVTEPNCLWNSALSHSLDSIRLEQLDDYFPLVANLSAISTTPKTKEKVCKHFLGRENYWRRIQIAFTAYEHNCNEKV